MHSTRINPSSCTTDVKHILNKPTSNHNDDVHLSSFVKKEKVKVYVQTGSGGVREYFIEATSDVKNYTITDLKQYENFPFNNTFKVFIIFRNGAGGLFYLPHDCPLIEFMKKCGFNNLDSDYYVGNHLFTKEQLQMTPSLLEECYNLPPGFVIIEKYHEFSFIKPPVFTKDVEDVELYTELYKKR